MNMCVNYFFNEFVIFNNDQEIPQMQI